MLMEPTSTRKLGKMVLLNEIVEPLIEIELTPGRHPSITSYHGARFYSKSPKYMILRQIDNICLRTLAVYQQSEIK